MTTYPDLGLDQTVRVDRFGAVTRGIPVPFEAANIHCGAVVGSHQPWLGAGDNTEVPIRCRKRVGHWTPPLAPHVPQDVRLVAAPDRTVHAPRFMRNGVPAGVDLRITVPHDCANHYVG